MRGRCSQRVSLRPFLPRQAWRLSTADALMNEDEYKSAYRAINERACPFEKAILSRQCGCQYAQRLQIADREAAGCRSVTAPPACHELLRLLRVNAQFALGMAASPGALPHGKEMKVQVGGLLGLQQLLAEAADMRAVENVYGLVRAAKKIHGELESLPFFQIVRSIASYRGRRRTRSRKH